jgi:hypothetical protein
MNYGDDTSAANRSGLWDTLSVTPRIYDLLKLRNGMDTLLASGYVKAGKISQIRLTLGTNNSILTDSGQSYPLPICNGKPYAYIKVSKNTINTLSNGQYIIRIDFDLASSIQDENGHFCLQPKLKSYSNNTTGKIQGTVKPQAAKATVMAYNATDTAYAISADDGEFQMQGVKPGTYSVLYKATSPYQDTTINNVLVQIRSEIKLPTVILH